MATLVPSSDIDDAFLAICVHDAKYTTRPDKQAAVKEYVKLVSMEDDETNPDYVNTLKEFTKEGAAMRQAEVTMTAVFKSLPTCLGLFPSLPIFKAVKSDELKSCIESLKHMLTQLTHKIGKGTCIESGEIVLGLEVLKGGADVILFCLAHEVGHAVCAQVQTVASFSYAAFREAIFPDWGSHKGIHLQEYFADAFGALIMATSGKSDSDIKNAATTGVASEGLTGDHPPDKARVAEVVKLLGRLK